MTVYRTGYDPLSITLIHTKDQGWLYDGPAGCGPKHIRKSGRGPCWRGPISAQFAGVLLRKLRERGLLV